MTPFLLPALAAYLLGSIPVGWLMARWKGVDLFAAGSGNVGATNVGRVLGRRWGLACFVLDLLKGAAPVAVAATLFPDAASASIELVGSPSLLATVAGASAFLGHLFPVTLGFRGGKGVATGAGTILVLVPGPAAYALLIWAAATLSTSTVSAGSVAAVLALMTSRLVATAGVFSPAESAPTCYVLAGSLFVLIKHRTNIRRLMAGTENRLDLRPRLVAVAAATPPLGLGLIFGAGTFFTFVAGPAIFRTLPSEQAGAAVSPIFPPFFGMQAAAWGLVLAALPSRGAYRRLLRPVAVLGLIIAMNWPLSRYVAAVRADRLSSDPALAEWARAAFPGWHLASLGLSIGTALLAGWLLARASADEPERG